MTRLPFISRVGTLAATVVLLPLVARAAGDVYQQREQSDREHGQHLEQLAVWCDQQGLAEEARRARQWLPVDRGQRLLLFDPTQPAERAKAEASPKLVEWHRRFGQLRAARAKKLFDLAQAADKAGHVSLAIELLGGVLREDPEHEAARRAWGYQQGEGGWHTPFSLAKHKMNHVWHERFGWLPQTRAARYEAGERYHKGRWISAEQDARLHADIDTGWELQTEHFEVVTNHSLEAAARFGIKLERLHAAWLQACGGFYATPGELVSAKFKPPRAPKRHQLMVFRNRAEYLQALRGEVPDDIPTTGIYISRRRTAYFFVPEDPQTKQPAFDDTVLYHEAVHQLFHETRAAVAEPGEKHNFWLIEGIACYFESLTERDGCLTVGGTDAERFRAAQYRFVNDGFYVPLETLCGMDRAALQRDPRIARLYSQSAGLTHYLMHASHGTHRDGLFTALTALYTGRDRRSTLSESLGEPLSTLDDNYHAFLRNAP